MVDAGRGRWRLRGGERGGSDADSNFDAPLEVVVVVVVFVVFVVVVVVPPPLPPASLRWTDGGGFIISLSNIF